MFRLSSELDVRVRTDQGNRRRKKKKEKKTRKKETKELDIMERITRSEARMKCSFLKAARCERNDGR